VGRHETSNAEKSARDNRLLVALLAAILVAYAITAFGIYELVKTIA